MEGTLEVKRINTNFVVFTTGFLMVILVSGYFVYEMCLHDYLDFSAFWVGGRALNLGLDPYQHATIVHLTPRHGPYMPFWSPIYLAQMMQPLAALPSHEARMTFVLINSVLGLVLLITLLRLSNIPITKRSLSIGLLLLISFEPFTGTLIFGQTDIIVTLSAALSLYLYRKQRYFLSGLVFCVAALNPHLILGVALYYVYVMIRHRNKRLFLGALVGTVALVLVSLPYYRYMLEWFQRILPLAQQMMTSQANQITVIHWLSKVGNHSVEIVLLVLIDLVLVASALIAWSSDDLWERDIAIAVAISLLTTTFAYHQDFLMLVLLVPYFIASWREGMSTMRLALFSLCAFTFWFSTMTRLSHVGWTLSVAPILSILLISTQITPNNVASRTRVSVLTLFVVVSLLGSFGTLLSTFNFESFTSLLGLFLFTLLLTRESRIKGNLRLARHCEWGKSLSARG